MCRQRYIACFINLLSATLCICISALSVYGQQISNISVIRTDTENSQNGVSTNDIIYESSAGYNYLGLEYGRLPLYMNDELVSAGGDKFIDRNANYYYVIQMDKNNQFTGFTNLYIRGINENLNWNFAGFGGGIGMTTKENLIYIYGAAGFTDSLFVQDEFIKSIPQNGAFVLTFNEQMDLVDEFYYGLDSLANHGDVQLQIDSDGDYHIAGRFFNGNLDNYNLEIGGEIIEDIDKDFETQTFYYVVVDHETKQTKVKNSFGGIFYNLARLNDFKINDNKDALLLFDQADELELNGELLLNGSHFFDITLLCLNEDSLKYYVNYEGPAAQVGRLIKKLKNDHSYEYIRTSGGEFPFIMNEDSIYYDSIQNNLIINRNPEGGIEWIQNIYGTMGGSDIFDMTLSDDNSTLWVSGTLKTGKCFLIDDQKLIVNDRFGGFLIALDAVTGEFKEVFYPEMESDEGVSPYTTIAQIQGADDGMLKVITQLGFSANSLKETYDYTIGDLTIPVSGKGELLIYDLDPDLKVSTQEITNNKHNVYPNPISPGQRIQVSDDINETYSIYNTSGSKLGRVKNKDQFPFITEGLYWLKGDNDGTIIKIIVSR